MSFESRRRTFYTLIILLNVASLSIGNEKKKKNKLPTVIDDDELNLIKYLFDDYNKEVRPVRNKSEPILVVLDLAYTQLVELDEKNQVMISNVWVRMQWNNHLLTWNPADFGGIQSINVDPKTVWLPDILLYNNADETLASGQMDQFKTKVILNFTGGQQWYAPAILRSRCGINIEFFPFDDQKCNLKFNSWTYDGNRIDLMNKTSTADLKFYLPSGEFELISAVAKRNIVYYSCCPNLPYPDITYTIHIRRKTLFYFNNLIVPCFLITALGLLTFVLPPATGERVTLVITTLLAMTVFMLMIAENTPTTSEVTPLIGKFFIASMVIIGLSLIATCIVLNLYECNRSVDTVPPWLRHLLVDVIAPFLRVDPPKERPNVSFGDSTNQIDTIAVTKEETNNEVVCMPRINDKSLTGRSNVSGHSMNWNPSHAHYDSDNNLRQRIVSVPEKLAEGIGILSDRAREQEKVEALAEEWQVVAKIADRFFLFVFLLTITVTTTYIFLSRPDTITDITKGS